MTWYVINLSHRAKRRRNEQIGKSILVHIVSHNGKTKTARFPYSHNFWSKLKLTPGRLEIDRYPATIWTIQAGKRVVQLRIRTYPWKFRKLKKWILIISWKSKKWKQKSRFRKFLQNLIIENKNWENFLKISKFKSKIEKISWKYQNVFCSKCHNIPKIPIEKIHLKIFFNFLTMSN